MRNGLAATVAVSGMFGLVAGAIVLLFGQVLGHYVLGGVIAGLALSPFGLWLLLSVRRESRRSR